MELSCVAGGGYRASKWAVRQVRNSSETSGNKKKRHKTNSVADAQ